jgi:DNA-binding transcriptional ArsR family regulator
MTPLRLLDPRFFRALSSATRVDVLRALSERPHTPAELSRRLGVAESTAQYHLDRLAAAGLARRRSDGRVWAYHELTDLGRSLAAMRPAAAGATTLALALLAAAAAAWSVALPDPVPPGTIMVPAPMPDWAPWALGAAIVLGLAAVAMAWAGLALHGRRGGGEPQRETPPSRQ